MSPAIRRALISVSDKSGIVELAQSLVSKGVELLSTGGTASLIAALKMAEQMSCCIPSRRIVEQDDR